MVAALVTLSRQQFRVGCVGRFQKQFAGTFRALHPLFHPRLRHWGNVVATRTFRKERHGTTSEVAVPRVYRSCELIMRSALSNCKENPSRAIAAVGRANALLNLAGNSAPA